MPAGPGESLLTTVYADVHYLFRVTPLSQPQQQRLAKGSYVYLYHSTSDKRTKLEIANHAGTPDQDAFYGYFDAVQRVTHSSKQPSLVTIVLEQSRISTQAEWHLATWDERNEKRWSHKLHTLNLYFWTERDAHAFVNHLKNVLPHDKLDVGPLPGQAVHAEHRNSMDPVVQQLEKTAINNQYPPRAGSATSAQSLPGPPTPASNVSGIVPPPPPPPTAQQSTPMAYNPAAPAAPEPIAHREKTPPPADGVTGTGLTNAARYDESQAHQPHQQYANYPQQHNASSLQNTPQSSYFPGAPQGTALPPPPPAPSQQQSQQQQEQSDTPTAQYASYPASSQYGQSVTSPGFPASNAAGLASPPAYGAQSSVQSPGQPPHSNPSLQAAQIAGYSQYSYNPGQQSAASPGQYNQHGAYSGNVHSQLYRPTEGEAANAHYNPQQQQQQQQQHQQHQQHQQPQQQYMQHQQQHQQHQQQPQGLGDKYKISERVNQMEKGIGGFLKKFDKKF